MILSLPVILNRVIEMKRMITGMAAALLAAILFPPFSVAAVSAQHAIVMDGQTGQVLYEKNADRQALIASTTKIMTALLICEQCNVLDRMEIPKEAVGIEGSSMYLQEGEVLTLQELLYGLMLQSGNDAAVALAIYCGGTVSDFAQLMNDKAHRLGMKNTHFVNPHGLDAPGHYSTARDLAILAAYAMNNPLFAQTVSAKTVTVGQRYLRNHNKLLWQLEGADGVKTGFTKAAGRILVSSAVRQGRRLIAVTINAPEDWNDHKYLLEHSFCAYTPQTLVEQGQILGTMEVAGGQTGRVALVASEDFVYSMQKTESWSMELPKPGFVYAPVVRDENAGYAHIYVEGKAVGKVRLTYADSVEMEIVPALPWWKRFFSGGQR